MFDGKPAAMSFTYDDAMAGHLDRAMPDLEAFSLRGTFYVATGPSKAWTWGPRQGEWAAAAGRGHEIGNHTRRHPCRGSNWSADLCTYSLEQITREIDDAEADIEKVAGRRAHSFAYPCCHTTVGPDAAQESYVGAVAKRFCGARVGGNLSCDPMSVDLMSVPSYVCRETTTVDEIARHVDEAIAGHRWAVLMFHGVGEGWIVTSAEVHRGICQYVAQQVAAQKLYCGTFVDVAQRIRKAKEMK